MACNESLVTEGGDQYTLMIAEAVGNAALCGRSAGLRRSRSSVSFNFEAVSRVHGEKGT
jgi:hypothetical protein